MKTKNDPGQTVYICPCCKLTFPTALNYRAHLKAQIKELEAELNSTYMETA